MMRWSRPILTLLWLTAAVVPAGAAETLPKPTPPCTDRHFDYLTPSANELRAIAYSCRSPAAVRLFLNRAQFREFLGTWGHLADIDGTGELGRRITAYRLYIVLVEQFSSQSRQSAPGWIVTLNRGYERAHRFGEPELAGYGGQR